MDVNYRIVFREDDDYVLLVDYIKKHNIEYEKKEDSPFIIFHILKSSPHWESISKLVRLYSPLVHPKMIYTEEERLHAEWLQLWCVWHYDYPQPEDCYQNIIYDRTNYCEHCDIGVVQNELVRMKRTPKWGRRAIAMVNWMTDDLFVSEATKTKLEQSGLTGFSFLGVKNKSGKDFLDDFYQIKFEFELPPGLYEQSSAILGASVCPICGRTKYKPNREGQLMFHKEIFENAPDIVRTSDHYGWEAAGRWILVSQKMYRFIKEQKMGRSLEFEPVILV